jgi:multidrug efflux pump subunit AcrB
MLTIPFGIIGAIYGHLVMGLPIAMFSIFGMVALTGVVVNDAIVLIEAINSNIARGLSTFDSITGGGVRRFRAIMLTSISTVGGLFPLIMEKDAQAQMIIPMALSIASGVMFATFLTLFFVPCLMGVLNDARRITHWLVRGEWPTREQVEPARTRNIDPLQVEADSDPLMAK